jgi:NitT/TauT family transport system substrate-binding protein
MNCAPTDDGLVGARFIAPRPFRRDAPRPSRRQALRLLLAGAASTLALSACQPARLIRRDPSRRLVVRINVYTSAAYAPLLQMRERRLLERELPGLSVEWKIIPAAEEVNQALRDGGVDLATGAPTAFLLARESNLPVRLIGGIGALPCAILGRAGLRSLAGIRPADRIAVPDESSLEAAVLQLAALRELGDARALAANTVSRSHADALPVIKLGNELAAHVAVTPFLELELEGTGPDRLIDSRDLFGGLPTSAVAYALPALRERSGPILDAFTSALAEGVRLASSDPIGTARLLTESDDLRAPPERIGAILARSGWQPGPGLTGVTRIAELWRRTDRLHRTPERWADLAFEGVQGN